MATLNATEKVGATEFTTPSDQELVATRIVEAPRHLVWSASTSPQHLPHWMIGLKGWTMPICEIDLRPGGAWRFGWRGPDGPVMEMHGAYREVTPPERLVSTENWGGEWPETLNTLVLTENDGKTTMTCTVRYPSRAARDAAMATGMKQGWSAGYDRLDKYLPTMERLDGRQNVQQPQSSKAATVSRKIFVNLPVKDLEGSMSFFRALGFNFNPQFTDDTAACMVISDDIYTMLLTNEKFSTFTPNEICNANKSTEVLLALTCESREAVGEMVLKAIAEGGRRYSEPKDYGFMLQDGFQDLDGHIWELIYMEPGALRQG